MKKRIRTLVCTGLCTKEQAESCVFVFRFLCAGKISHEKLNRQRNPGGLARYVHKVKVRGSFSREIDERLGKLGDYCLQSGLEVGK